MVWSSSGFGHTAVYGAAESDRSSHQFDGFGCTCVKGLSSIPDPLDPLPVLIPGTCVSTV